MNAPRIRVMIVDDSTVIRRLLTNTLAESPEIEVVGTAPNGKIALAKIPTLKPDVMTLDIEMPEMDGLQTLLELRKVNTKLPVIMFSTLTQRGAEGTLDALENGANDYVGKPANVGSVTEAMTLVRSEMVPKIKALCPWFQDRGQASKKHSLAKTSFPSRTTLDSRPGARTATHATRQASPGNRSDIIAIGVSTGGPNALSLLLPELPADLAIPIVIVQHMPPIFTKHLADRLNQKCAIQVAEAKAGSTLTPGTVWIAPGDYHMTVAGQSTKPVLQLNQAAPENSCRPAVDVLFRSVAKTFGRNALACVLTGMGSDGLNGAQAIADAGGHIIAQDQETSVVWGMPAAVTQAGLPNQILPLGRIGSELARHALRGRSRHSFSAAGA